MATGRDIELKHMLALNTASEVSKFFGIPIPKVIFSPIGTYGIYYDGTIVLSTNIPMEKVEGVVAHEVAHASHHYFGIPCHTHECEAFASVFEDYWTRRKRLLKCSKCSYPLLPRSSLFLCLKCSTAYAKRGTPPTSVI